MPPSQSLAFSGLAPLLCFVSSLLPLHAHCLFLILPLSAASHIASTNAFATSIAAWMATLLIMLKAFCEFLL